MNNDNEDGSVTVTPDQLSGEGRDLIGRAIAQGHDMLAGAPPYSWIEHGQIVSPTPENPGYSLIEAILQTVFFVDPVRIDMDSVPPEMWDQARTYAATFLRLHGQWNG